MPGCGIEVLGPKNACESRLLIEFRVQNLSCDELRDLFLLIRPLSHSRNALAMPKLKLHSETATRVSCVFAWGSSWRTEGISVVPLSIRDCLRFGWSAARRRILSEPLAHAGNTFLRNLLGGWISGCMTDLLVNINRHFSAQALRLRDIVALLADGERQDPCVAVRGYVLQAS